ncbi:MAG: aquaporin [Meiothermus sp.]|nr:aquaporin [Meiothermus sp.]
MARACAAEFLGTFALLFAVVGAIAGGVDRVGVILLNGLVIAAMIAALGAASGAHFNPAVTLAMLLTGRIAPSNALCYAAAQLAGAAAGVGLLTLLLGPERLARVNFGAPALGGGVSPWAGVGLEAALTFLLVFVIFATAVHLKNPAAAGYIGAAVALGVAAGAGLTGGAMNPARSFGSALWGGGLAEHWVYWVGPLAGGVLAAWAADWIYGRARAAGGQPTRGARGIPD